MDASPGLARAHARAFAPWLDGPSSAPDATVLSVHVRDGQEPPPSAERQGDAGDGVASATHDGRLWWRGSGRWSSLEAGVRPAVLTLDGREPAWRLVPIVRSIARRSLPAAGAVAVHGSLVEVGGRGILISGWSESGKTEVALALAASGGGRLAGDKWTIVAEGRAWPLPGAAGLREWVVPYLEGDLATPSRAERVRRASGRPISAATRGVRGLRRLHPAVDILGQPVERLLPLVPTVRREPGRLLRSQPVSSTPFGSLDLAAVVLLLVTGDRPEPIEMDREAMLERIHATTSHEEALALDLERRARYGGVPWFTCAAANEALARSLASVPLLAVASPFPADPRPIAALIEGRL